MDDAARGRWRIPLLVACHVAAALLFASWVYQPTAAWWEALDLAGFWAMNRSLEWNEAWRVAWAIANHRAFDLVAAAFMLGLMGHRALLRDRENLPRYMAVALMMLVSMVAGLQIGKRLPIVRPSATNQFPQANRLSKMVPWIATKDESSDSFPGDHGYFLLVYTVFMAVYFPPGYLPPAAAIAVVFTAPRVVSGAHWLTDELVGAVAMALVLLSWVFATPLHARALARIEPEMRWVVARVTGTPTPGEAGDPAPPGDP